MRPSPRPSYSFAQKLAHWMILALCVVQFPTAGGIQRTHHVNPFGIKPAPFDLVLHKVHAWSGWMILLLATILLLLRVVRGGPALPQGMNIAERGLARLGHVALYGGILVLATTGTLAAYFSPRFAPLHALFTYVGVGLVFLHAAAALWHQFIRRDNLLARMLFGRTKT